MNSGIGHEAGETARTLVEALRSTPAILALVIFNILFMASVVYIQHANGERWQAVFDAVIKQCGDHK